MVRMLTDEDLSLRHLPDISDSSFSFQIPTTLLPRGGDLMAEDNTFFENANPNITLTTPEPPAVVARRLTLQEFAPRLESSPLAQQPQASPYFKTPSTSYGHIESHPLPINEAPISSKQIRSLRKEITKHKHQDQGEPQEPDPCLSVSVTSSSTLNNILPPPPAFPERLSLGSQPEASYSGLDLLQVASSAASSGHKEELQGNANPRGSRRGHLGNKSRPSKRLIATSRPPRQSLISGGGVKSRRLSVTKGKKSVVNASLSTTATRTLNNRHRKPDRSLDSFGVDRSLDSNLCMSSFALSKGATVQRVMSSQQFMNAQDDDTEPINQGAEPRVDGHELQGVRMKVDPCLTDDTHMKSSGGQEDDRDRPLTISQLSPRKRSAVQFSTSNKKQHAPAFRHNRQSQTRDTSCSSSSGPRSLAASVVAPLDLGSVTSGACLGISDVTDENEGGRMEGIMVDNKHAKTQRSSMSISTNASGSSARVVDSGLVPIPGQVVKRPVRIGARNRTRRKLKSPSAVSGGGISRPRSNSNSVSARADVLCASKRGKRLSQVRTRKDRARDHLNKSGQLGLETGNIEEVQTSTSVDKLRRSDIQSSTRPVEFRFASDLRIQARKGYDGQKMRSISSSSSTGNSVVRPIPDCKMLHVQIGASQAHRKENVHPVTAQPFHWATDQRIKQRREFDDMVREKVRQREVLEEQKRKEMEEEEERGIRELRKRLIPKANVVPEWYKGVPRRTKDEGT